MFSLRPREKALAVSLAVAAAGLGLYGFLIKPAVGRVQTLERVIPAKQRELQDLTVKTRRVTTLVSQMAAARQAIGTSAAVELLPAVESVVSRQGLTARLATMNQKATDLDAGQGQIAVELALDKVSLKEVLGFLQDVQISIPAVRVSSLHLSRHPLDPHLLNATITLRRAQKMADG